MKKYSKTLFILFISLLIMIGCTNLEEVNKNIDQPPSASMQLLLPGIIFEPINPQINFQFKFSSQVFQYLVWRNEGAASRYEFASQGSITDPVWTASYLALRDSKEMQKLAKEKNMDAYIAAGKILDAFHLANLTEIWGDVPYEEAGLGAEKIDPKFDTQESVYTVILNNLKEGNEILQKSEVKFTFGGDILHNGNVMNWRRFANSLRLRYLLRISNVRSDTETEIKDILTKPTEFPIITSNNEAAVYDFSGLPPDVPDWSLQAISFTNGISVTERLVEILKGDEKGDDKTDDDDPRLAFFAKKGQYDIAPTYIGAKTGVSASQNKAPTGYNPEKEGAIVTDRFQLNKGALSFAFISYSEVEFILAELVLKGWHTGNAQTHYENAVKANIEYWNLVVPTNLFGKTYISWDGNGTTDENRLARLMEQKWISAFATNSLTAWGDYRRTGLPNFNEGRGSSVAISEVPTRMFYPIVERSVNTQNYNDVISRMGGTETITNRFWYQSSQ